MEIVSLGLWIARLFGKTPSTKIARRLGIGAAIVGGLLLLVVGAWVGVSMYNRGVIEQHEQAQEAHDARKALEADRSANEAIGVQASETAEENERLEEALAEAKAKDPEKGEREVGPVTKSYFDQLRKKK